MLHTSQLLGTAAIAAFAMSLLHSAPKYEIPSSDAKPTSMIIQRAASSAQTVSNVGIIQPAQTQRWVF